MDIELLAKAIDIEVRDTTNDIDAYLASDVPLECYRKDIDLKLTAMRERLKSIARDDAVELWPRGTVVNVEPDIDDDFHAFTGTIISHRKELIQVCDQDNDVFDVAVHQLSRNTDGIMHDAQP